MQDSPLSVTLTQEQTALEKGHLIVIGGSSGIGLALALHHQNLGWQVSIVGSNASKISIINNEYSDIITYQCDLNDMAQRQQLFDKLEDVSFNRLIYSAGHYTNERVHTLNKADSDLMLSINLQVFNAVFGWASQQLKRRSQDFLSASTTPPAKLSLISIASIAGTMDYPYSSLYAKSKRAMIATASAYRCALQPYDIQVTCIASGYIDTQALRDLNDGDASHKPFIIDTATAITHIMQAIEDNVELAIFPRPMRYVTQLLNKLPKPLLNRLLRVKLYIYKI